jgi:hypothetical protein
MPDVTRVVRTIAAHARDGARAREAAREGNGDADADADTDNE